MADNNRPLAFWVIVLFLGASIILMLMGQTMAVFNYDLAVRLGLQESLTDVSRFGVEVNRGFGAGDTVVYIPLLVASLAGLLLKRHWSLLTTAAAAGVSAYWAATATFILFFLPGTPGYSYVPGPEIWLFVGTYAVFGVWALFYLVLRGDALLHGG